MDWQVPTRMTVTLAKTPLHDWHADHGGRMVEFGGWSMPVQYTSIVDEHLATRKAVGLFDISHMGRLRFDGEGAARFLDSLVTRKVEGMPLGQIRYGLLTNERGGTIDDVLVYHLEDDDGPFHLLVVNAGNREKAVCWIDARLDSTGDSTGDVKFQDQSLDLAMVAVQGPDALQIVSALVDFDPAEMKYYTGRCVAIADTTGIVSRTGYTGEDGCELVLPAAAVEEVWKQLVDRATATGGSAVGLGARDTLRLEAAMPLYGHELGEDVS
ncbi:MAG: glycine cleavage system aminomethyltransferase GcvT, partial [Planctomycetales bacterium]